MGVWGPSIFSSDIALDIKQEYQTLLAFGTPDDEAYQLIKDHHKPEDDDVEFWFSMATIQQKYGILLPDVKERALACIAEGCDDELWEGADKKVLQARVKVRNRLKDNLLGAPLPRKKVPKPHFQKPRWSIGNVIASQLISPYKSDKWYSNKYILYCIVHLKQYPLTLLKPDLGYSEWAFAALYDWIGDEPPSENLLGELDFFINENPESYDFNKSPVHAVRWFPKTERYTLIKERYYEGITSDSIILEQKNPISSVYTPVDSVPPLFKELELTGTGDFAFTTLQVNETHFKGIYAKYKS